MKRDLPVIIVILVVISPILAALALLALAVLLLFFLSNAVTELVAIAAFSRHHRQLLMRLHKTGGRPSFFDFNVYDAYEYYRQVEECKKEGVPEWRIHWAV